MAMETTTLTPDGPDGDGRAPVHDDPADRRPERRRSRPPLPRGDLHGISGGAVARLLESEASTSTLVVRSGDRVGFLYFVGGELVDARVGDLTGLHAAFRCLSWDAPSFELCPGEEDRERTISEPLERVLQMVSKARRQAARSAPDAPAATDLDATDPLLDLAGDRAFEAPRRPGAAATNGAGGALSVDQALGRLLEAPAEGAAVVDVESGMCLDSAGEMPYFEIIAAMSMEILSVEEAVVRRLASRDRVEDVLVTLGQHLHVLRPLRRRDGFCLFAVFDRRKTKLAWARHRVAEIEERLHI